MASSDPYYNRLAIAQTVARFSRVPPGHAIAIDAVFSPATANPSIESWPCQATVSIGFPHAKARWQNFYTSASTLGERSALLNMSEMLKEEVKQRGQYSQQSFKRAFHVHAHVVPKAPHVGYFCFNTPCDKGFEYKHPDPQGRQDRVVFQSPEAPFGWQYPASAIATPEATSHGFGQRRSGPHSWQYTASAFPAPQATSHGSDQLHDGPHNWHYRASDHFNGQQDGRATQPHQGPSNGQYLPSTYGSAHLTPHAEVFQPDGGVHQGGQAMQCQEEPFHWQYPPSIYGSTSFAPQAAAFQPSSAIHQGASSSSGSMSGTTLGNAAETPDSNATPALDPKAADFAPVQ